MREKNQIHSFARVSLSKIQSINNLDVSLQTSLSLTLSVKITIISCRYL